MLTIPGSAVALAAGQADAQSEIQINVSSAHVGYGHHVTVTGTVPSGTPGKAVALEFARAGSSSWRTLSSTRVRNGGRFRFVNALRRTGLLRAVAAAPASAPRATATAATAVAPSPPRRVSVASEFDVRRRSMNVLDGRAVEVGGSLLPGDRGRKVRLEGRSHGAWRVVAAARTSTHGAFRIHYRPYGGAGGARGQQLRVQFGGDSLNTGALRRAGQLRTFTQSLASWYYDGGNTACGFHAGLGVANKALPCGTRVSFRFRGRTVTAVVDDRGPYVGGREWDLNQNTAGALGFYGVGTVWSTS
jgi:hypothetical protein